MLLLIEMAATLLVVSGVWFVALPDIKGQYMLVAAQLLWTIFAICNGHVFFTVQSALLLLLTLYAIYNWTKKGVGCNVGK